MKTKKHNPTQWRLCGQHVNASDDKCPDLARHSFLESDRATFGLCATAEDIEYLLDWPKDRAFVIEAVNCHAIYQAFIRKVAAYCGPYNFGPEAAALLTKKESR